MVLVGDIIRLTTGEVKILTILNEDSLEGYYAFDKIGDIPKDVYNFEVIQLIPRDEEILIKVSKDDMNELYRIMKE